MVKRLGSSRRKSRHKMKKNFRRKGKVSMTNYFRKYTKGDNVCLVAEPAVQKGLYHMRYHGKRGIIQAKQGFCYAVQIQDGGVKKTFVIHPVHLKKLD